MLLLQATNGKDAKKKVTTKTEWNLQKCLVKGGERENPHKF
jgi:hypothetical protein